jgi:predicted ATPase/class 3 adenylate cyclase
MTGLPTGTVTFLFTDIEGSTRFLQDRGDAGYRQALADHNRLLRDAFEPRRGHEVEAQGDGFLIAFQSARDAVAAAVVAQRALAAHRWPNDWPVRVRMGLHTGEAMLAESGYVGLDVHRAARICSAGHGGQILLSEATRAMVEGHLSEGLTLRDLGEHRLKDLAHPHRLFQIVAPDLPADFQPLKSLDVLPNNLPTQLTSFIGREREIAEVKTMLATTRLVTLTGAGGSGKTRLALQVGADLLEQFADGVWFVDLAALTDAAFVSQTVASALRVPEQPGRAVTDTLTDYLRPKSLLLLLDNCEHVLAACAYLTDVLLRACPNLRILATSREGMGIAGEALYPVPTLPVPDPERLPSVEDLVRCESVRLFIERATAVLPSFKVNVQNTKAVAQLCHHLDGIPLAIELAAVRVRTLAVEQIVTRLADRFRLLTKGTRTAPPRHQTLQATMDWSYGLLSGKEQAMLRRLSVFAGGCTLDSAESVCSGNGLGASEVLDLLTQLVDKSLVIAEMQYGEARYRSLETVRQYGRERLIERREATAFLGRQLDWCLALAEQAERELLGPSQRAWLARLEAEHDNLRAALAWSCATEERVEEGLRLAAALRVYWLRRGHWSEGRQRLADMLSHGAAQQFSPPMAKALYAIGQMAEAQDHDAEAAMYLKRALAAYQQLQDRVGTAYSLYGLGMIAHKQGDQESARSYFEGSLAIFRESGDKPAIAAVLSDLAEIAAIDGDYTSAHLMLLESLAMRRESGDIWGIGVSLNDLGQLARLQGDYHQAAALYQESLQSHLESGSKAGVAWARYNLGIASLHTGDYWQAATLFRESLSGYIELESKSGIGEAILGLASIAIAKGQVQRGARLLSTSEHLLELADHTLDRVDRLEFDRNVATVRAVLNEQVFIAMWAEGRAMTLEQAIEYALADQTG